SALPPPRLTLFPHRLCALSFSRYRPLRALHSFPTRRSSDLIDVGDARIGNVVYRNGTLWTAHPVFYPCCAPTTPPNRSRDRRPRSEEHTSELQSLRHLVCRLLLEKKNKPHDQMT